MSHLDNLWVHGNSLEGPLPSDLCGIDSRLFFLILDDNNLSGPLDLSFCSRLQYFGAKVGSFACLRVCTCMCAHAHVCALDCMCVRVSMYACLFMRVRVRACVCAPLLAHACLCMQVKKP